MLSLHDSEARTQYDIFTGPALPTPHGRSFGGQVLGQALAAAGETVEKDRPIHSMHGYFLRPGDAELRMLDLVDIARLADADAAHRVPPLAFQSNTLEGAMSSLPVLPMSEVVTSYYLRLRVSDEAGVLAKVTGILAGAGISIDAVLQREADEIGGEGSTQTDLIILTHDTREGDMDAALVQIQALPTVLAPINRIRKEELN